MVRNWGSVLSLGWLLGVRWRIDMDSQGTLTSAPQTRVAKE